jgi:hypothetical protein
MAHSDAAPIQKRDFDVASQAGAEPPPDTILLNYVIKYTAKCEDQSRGTLNRHDLLRLREGAKGAVETAVAKAVDTNGGGVTTEAEWQHRIAKRRESIEMIKGSQEYCAYAARVAREQRSVEEPVTPPYKDRSLSTRQWKYDVSQWRLALRAWAQRNGD